MVSILSDGPTEETRLTERDRVYKEGSGLHALNELVNSSFDLVNDGVVVLLDGISVGDHQNDSPCHPERTHTSEMLNVPAPRVGEIGE